MSIIVICTVNAEFTCPTQSSLSLLVGAMSFIYCFDRMFPHRCRLLILSRATAPSSAQWSTSECAFSHCHAQLGSHCPSYVNTLSFHTYLLLILYSISVCFCSSVLFFFRLESQLLSDMQAILQLLQRQPTLGPPAYSTVTANPDYHRSAVKVQPAALNASHFFSSAGTQVRMPSL